MPFFLSAALKILTVTKAMLTIFALHKEKIIPKY